MTMTTPKLSLFGYLFNAKLRSFDLDATIANFTAFADEVVLSTVASNDDTYERLVAYEDRLGSDRFKVVMTDIDPLKNNRFDGDLKTAALQRCTHPIRVIADCDERFMVSQRALWDAAATRLLSNPHQDGWLIPVVDLYGSRDTIRLAEPIGVKFRMHKDTIVRRGVPQFAERGGGLLDTSQSDTTEPLRANGELGSFVALVPDYLRHPSLTALLNDHPYVIHEGFLDLQRRAKIGAEWWKPRWEERSGRIENVLTDIGDLREVATVKHSLKLT